MIYQNHLPQLVIESLSLLTEKIIVAHQLCIFFYLGGQLVKHSADQSQPCSTKQPQTIGM